MRTHLISFGDDKYTEQKKFLKKTAEISGFFDEIDIYSPDDIDDEFYSAFYAPLAYSRGGGYWIWKPYLIRKALDKIRNNDVLVYCDAGCMINREGKDRFKDYLKLLKTSETGTLDFELPHKEFQYTKQEVFNHFHTPAEVILSNQLMATVIMLRKCKHTQMLVHKWYETILTNVYLFTDEKVTRQHPGFIDHRHDQSVFSVIRKTHGANIIPDETYFLDFIKDGKASPIWATRLKG